MKNTKYAYGMYGGSFNPLHLGHVRCMLQAANQCERLIVVISAGSARNEFDINRRYRWVYETILSVFASLLMLLRYREQWILWIVIDAVSVAMWIAARDILMIIMWTIFFINAIYGFLNWTWTLKKDRETAPQQ